jgi:hypothetical protein
MRVGLISDTHGLLRPSAAAFLRGCNHIIHAGDIGSERILHELSGIAPVTAVRGNNDTDAWAASLPESTLVQLGAIFLFVIHDLTQLDIDPHAAGVRVVVSGHSHRPLIQERDGVIYVNPGSAGPRRFRLPITAAEIGISGNSMTSRITELSAETTARPASPRKT